MPNRCLNIRFCRAQKFADIVTGFGPIKPDTLPLTEIAAHRKEASEMVDRVGFNDGPEN